MDDNGKPKKLSELMKAIEDEKMAIEAAPPSPREMLLIEFIKEGWLIPVQVFGGAMNGEAWGYGLSDVFTDRNTTGSDCNRAAPFLLRPMDSLMTSRVLAAIGAEEKTEAATAEVPEDPEETLIKKHWDELKLLGQYLTLTELRQFVMQSAHTDDPEAKSILQMLDDGNDKPFRKKVARLVAEKCGMTVIEEDDGTLVVATDDPA